MKEIGEIFMKNRNTKVDSWTAFTQWTIDSSKTYPFFIIYHKHFIGITIKYCVTMDLIRDLSSLEAKQFEHLRNHWARKEMPMISSL